MNRIDSMFKENSMQKASLMLALVVFMVFVGAFSTATALDRSQKLSWNAVPTIPITLEYYPEEVEALTGKYETRQYVFHRKEWESWKTPGINVTLRLNHAGNIEISECEAFVSASQETTSPKFVTTEQNVAIEGNQIRVTLSGYLDYGSYQSDEQTFVFKVCFFAVLESLNGAKQTAIFPTR
jgi:hypothetical protein